jgi:hypothetical protein
MVQAVFRQPVTEETRVRIRTSPRVICAGLSISNSGFPCLYHPISIPCSSLQTAIVKRPSGRSVVTLKRNGAIQEFEIPPPPGAGPGSYILRGPPSGVWRRVTDW